jgi:hypothetical protein
MGIVGRATLKMLRRKSKMQFVKKRAQYAKLNCAFELFIVHCAATINAKNASFHQKKCCAKNATSTLLIRFY